MKQKYVLELSQEEIMRMDVLREFDPDKGVTVTEQLIFDGIPLVWLPGADAGYVKLCALKWSRDLNRSNSVELLTLGQQHLKNVIDYIDDNIESFIWLMEKPELMGLLPFFKIKYGLIGYEGVVVFDSKRYGHFAVPLLSYIRCRHKGYYEPLKEFYNKLP